MEISITHIRRGEKKESLRKWKKKKGIAREGEKILERKREGGQYLPLTRACTRARGVKTEKEKGRRNLPLSITCACVSAGEKESPPPYTCARPGRGGKERRGRMPLLSLALLCDKIFRRKEIEKERDHEERGKIEREKEKEGER